jgi:hypothetical protein
MLWLPSKNVKTHIEREILERLEEFLDGDVSDQYATSYGKDIEAIVRQYLPDAEEVCRIEEMPEDAKTTWFRDDEYCDSIFTFVYSSKAMDYFIVVLYNFDVEGGGCFDIKIANAKEYRKYVNKMVNEEVRKLRKAYKEKMDRIKEKKEKLLSALTSH